MYKFCANELIKKPSDANPAPMNVVIRQPKRLVKIDPTGPI